MRKKYPEHQLRILDWHSVPEEEFFPYARAFRAAAKKMAAAMEANLGPSAKFAACPVVFMYRHALELYLKAFVLGDGRKFLAIKPDALSVCKTHSVSWLAQFVCQIVTALMWENQFKCEGIETLTDFKEVVEDINSVDPGPHSFRYPAHTQAAHSGNSISTFNAREFARRMDALLELLDSTSDAMAALYAGKDIGPTIH